MAFKVGNRAQEEMKMTLVLTDAIVHFQEAKVTRFFLYLMLTCCLMQVTMVFSLDRLRMERSSRPRLARVLGASYFMP